MEGGIPLRVPIGEYAIDSDTIEKVIGHETYLRAKAKTKIAFWEGRRDEVAQSWKEDNIELYRKLPFFDIINLAAECTAILPPSDTPRIQYKKLNDTTYELENGDIYCYSPISRDLVLTKSGTFGNQKEENFQQEPMVKAPDSSCFEVYDVLIDEFKDEFFIIGCSGAEVGMVQLGTTEETLLEYALNPELIRKLSEKQCKLANMMDIYYMREGLDAILWGQDHSYNSGPLISPDMFRDFVLPVYKSRVNSVQKSLGLYIFKHACGNNWKLLDMYVEAGFDAYQSVQASAGMDLKQVKDAYGNKLVLWGGVPLELLQSGTAREVRDASRAALKIGKPNGGYIFGSSHSIATGTKYNNFMAMLDEYQKNCMY